MVAVYPFPRWLTWTLLAAAVAFAWLLAAVFARNSSGPGGLGASLAGVGFGSLCAIGTVAAIWTALGPLAIVIRLPFAVVMQVSVVLTVAALEGRGTVALENVGVFSGFIFGQYLLAQVPLWFVAKFWVVHIASFTSTDVPEWQTREQFRIRHVMIFTAIIAVFLGIARAVVQAWELQAAWPDLEIFLVIGFIVLCNTMISLPLAFAILLPQRWMAAGSLALAFVVLISGVEVPTFLMIRDLNATDEVSLVIVAMNVSQTFWVLLAMAILRMGGYRLTKGVERSVASNAP